MKKSILYILNVLLVAAAFTACSPEDWSSPKASGVPSAANIKDTIIVDQTTNQVTFSISNPGCYPIWIFDGTTYSTVNGMSKIYAKAGTYQVEVKIGNANGISDGSVTRTFTINNTIVDFSSYVARLAGDSSKVWVIASKEAGHLSCGEPGTDGTNWYSAAANEKAAMGLYDDMLTFTKEKGYTYNPGTGGTVYVNVGCTLFSAYNTTSSDFMAPVQIQTTKYDFDVVGDNVYLTLPDKTLFPYIPYDASYNTPRFKIVKLTADRLELIADNGAIAWHFILVTQSSQKADRQGYDPDNDCNMWKHATFTNRYYYAPNWGQIADPVMTKNGNSYTIALPSATTDQWQAQCFFETDLTTNAKTNYDFSCKLTSTKDIAKATVKLYRKGDDANAYFTDNVKLTAYSDTYVIHTNMTGIDMDYVNIVLDFGGNPDGTEVTLSDVVLKEHSCDDGTVIDDPNKTTWDEMSSTNLWKDATFTNSFYYAPNWAQIADPVVTKNGTAYTISLPTATTDQWQAQCFFKTNIATSSKKKYDFRCIFNSNKDIAKATVKLYKNGDDNTFFFTENITLKAFEEFSFEKVGLEGLDIDNVNLVLDFGGNPDGTEITLSGIILRESSDTGGGDSKVNWVENSYCNMWMAGTFTNSYYYAPAWAQIADPVLTKSGTSYTIALPTATTDQWQAQCFFKTNVATNSTNTYDFRCIFNSNKDLSNVTVKLYKNGDDNTFYFTDRINLKAFEDYSFEKVAMPGLDIDNVNLVLDFGGNPDGTEVTLSGIILKESSCNE